jgi:hypothetical protein
MTKSKTGSKEVNCISDCVNALNKRVCQGQCGKIRSNPSFECTVDCVKRNQETGSSRKKCSIKCKNNKKAF